MGKNVRQTSIDAYYQLENLVGRRKLVFNAIKAMGLACNLDIAYYLKQPINRITPRTNELVKMGLVEEAKRDITPRTGKRVIFWEAI